MNIEEAADKLFTDFRKNKNLVGTGIIEKDKEKVISVYVADKKMKKDIPATYEGFKTFIEVTGHFYAQ